LISLDAWDNTGTVAAIAASLVGVTFGLFVSSSILFDCLCNLLLQKGFLTFWFRVIHSNELITVFEKLVEGDFDVVAMLFEGCFALRSGETHVH
jgi:hypothetical protein